MGPVESTNQRVVRIQRVNLDELARILKNEPTGPFLHKDCYVRNKSSFDEMEDIAGNRDSKKYDLYLWGVQIGDADVKLISALTKKSAIHYILQLVITDSRKITFEWSPRGYFISDFDERKFSAGKNSENILYLKFLNQLKMHRRRNLTLWSITLKTGLKLWWQT